MAISKPAVGSAGTWSSGSTIVSSSMSCTAGDILVCVGLFDPAARTCTFSKTAGTGAVGAFTHRSKITGGAMGITMGYCSVTTTGTITITATADTTPTNGHLVIQVYRGASGVLGGTGGTGSTGTAIALSKQTIYANSWVVMAAGLIGNNPGAPTGGTGCTIEQTISSNITGTTNDLGLAIGSNEAALTIQNFTSNMAKGNNVTYVADIIELVQQFTVSVSGTAAGSQGSGISHQVKAVSVTEFDTVSKIVSQIKAIAVTASATASGEVGASNKEVSLSGLVNNSIIKQVLTNLKSVTVTEFSALSKIASSLKTLNVLANDSIHIVNATGKSVSVTESSQLLARILTNLKSVVVTVNCSVSCVAMNLVIGSGNSSVAILLFVSNQSVNASGRMRTSLICESSTPQAEGPKEVPLDAGWIITRRIKKRVVY